jgi:hypothetical protein
VGLRVGFVMSGKERLVVVKIARVLNGFYDY